MTEPGGSAMKALQTLPQMLEALAGERERGLTFVRRDGTRRVVPFAELLEGSRRRAAALERRGLRKGDRVVVILTEAEDFVFTFFGMVLGGIVPVPVYPPFRPNMLRYAATVRHVVETSQSRTLLTEPALKARLKLDHVRDVILSGELAGVNDKAPVPSREASIGLDDTAFIQFTSGSTAFPKGVVLSHRNLASNVRCFMEEGVGVTPDDVGVCWLPLYHDMGLIGQVLGATYYGMPTTFMSPLVFIRRPVRWLELITEQRGGSSVVSFAPNFAYGFCAARVKDLGGLDLSSWRVAGCGSEPISVAALKSFAERFAPVGFREEAFLCAYGMAESSLAVTFAPVGGGVSAECVDAASLQEKGVAVAQVGGERDHEGAVQIVSCGKPFSGHEVAVVDGDDNPLPERQVGQIVTRGPSVMQGYFDNEEASRSAIPTWPERGWLHSGDLGFIVDGDLYVCGRIKDLIIVAGRNYYPQDIEWAAGAVEGVRTGNVIAFGLTEGDTESVVVVAETRLPRSLAKKRHEALALEVRRAVHDAVGIRADKVLLAPPGTLPKTSSGKLQRRKARDEYLSGELLRRKPLLRRMANRIVGFFARRRG